MPKAMLLNGQKFCSKHPACVCSGFREWRRPRRGGCASALRRRRPRPLPRSFRLHAPPPPAAVLVKPSESEKNYAALAEAAGGSAASAANERRVYLGDIAPGLTLADLKQVAEAVGPTDKIVMLREGLAVVTFTAKDGAERALAALNGIEIAGSIVKVRGKHTARGAFRRALLFVVVAAQWRPSSPTPLSLRAPRRPLPPPRRPAASTPSARWRRPPARASCSTPRRRRR